MASIFDLNETGKLSPANQGVTNYRQEQVDPSRPVTSTQFAGGLIDYNFAVSGNEWWIPNRSYLKLRVSIETSAGAQFNIGTEKVAPVINAPASLFTNGSVRLNGHELSIITSEMAEIDTLKNRMTKSGAWLNGVGGTDARWDASFVNRLNIVREWDPVAVWKRKYRSELGFGDAATIAISAAAAIGDTGTVIFAGTGAAGVPLLGEFPHLDLRTGDVLRPGDIFYIATRPAEKMRITGWTDTRTATYIAETVITVQVAIAENFYRDRIPGTPMMSSKYEIIWRPPMSVFQLDKALPVGRYKVSLQPSPQWQTRFVQSMGVSLTENTDFKVNILKCDFFATKLIGPRVKQNTLFYIDLDETAALTSNVAGHNQFTVASNSNALTVAYSDENAGGDTQYPITLFKGKNIPLSGGTNIGESTMEMGLTSFQVQYAGKNLPRVTADPVYDSDTGKFFQQLYNDTYIYNGMFFDSAGPESFEEYVNRGPYMYLPFPKDADNEDTRVTIRHGFAATTGVELRVMLFYHYKRMAIIEIVDGRVKSVNVRTA